MKQITIIFLLIIVSCKSETKTDITTETEIDKSVSEMWRKFTMANPKFKSNELPDSYFFHDNEEDANRLLNLILNEKKKAGSGLYAWYKDANADLPKVGAKSIITNFKGKAKAIIEITKVDTIPFNQISNAYAEIDMGTNIEPLKKWKKAHWEFFTSTMEDSKNEPTENMLVVCEYFKLIWTEQDH